MAKLTRCLDRFWYPKHQDNWDNQAFREEVLRSLRPGARLLDLGAGAGIVSHMNFRGMTGQVCGLDPDQRVLHNPYLDEACIGHGEAIPYADAYFDVVIANNVLEHLDQPLAVFEEVARVLKPGGLFITKTPNRRHYVPLIAALTPHWFHQLVNTWRGRAADDTFLTRYLANTPQEIRRHGTQAGLDLIQVSLIEGRPEYLRMTAPTYLCGWFYERAVNFVPGLSIFRCVMISTLRKPVEKRVFASPQFRAA